jgi:transposase-like protein
MFRPPHCTNPECPNYFHPPSGSWYKRIAPYDTITFGPVPRFRCKTCRKTFSSQTFSIDYYAKKKLSHQYIFNQINAGAGLRNIARNLKVSPKAITNRINRMARNALLIQQVVLDELPFSEHFAADGFESFCVSQYFPDNYNILVGRDSQFVYQWNYTTLRRKGRMNPLQKRKRKRLEKIYRATPRGIENTFTDLLEFLEMRTHSRGGYLILSTDEKKDYERALYGSPACRKRMYDGSWRHQKVNSKDPRTIWNPLFPVNYMDREFRKDMACHARETLQFSRNVNEAMLRMSLYVFDHNFFKPFRVADREKKHLRHAEVAGLKREYLDEVTSGFFYLRYFWRKHHPMEKAVVRTLHREWETPLKKMGEVVRKHLAA